MLRMQRDGWLREFSAFMSRTALRLKLYRQSGAFMKQQVHAAGTLFQFPARQPHQHPDCPPAAELRNLAPRKKRRETVHAKAVGNHVPRDNIEGRLQVDEQVAQGKQRGMPNHVKRIACRPERVAVLDWNRWRFWTGIGGGFESE